MNSVLCGRESLPLGSGVPSVTARGGPEPGAFPSLGLRAGLLTTLTFDQSDFCLRIPHTPSALEEGPSGRYGLGVSTLQMGRLRPAREAPGSRAGQWQGWGQGPGAGLGTRTDWPCGKRQLRQPLPSRCGSETSERAVRWGQHRFVESVFQEKETFESQACRDPCAERRRSWPRCLAKCKRLPSAFSGTPPIKGFLPLSGRLHPWAPPGPSCHTTLHPLHPPAART